MAKIRILVESLDTNNNTFDCINGAILRQRLNYLGTPGVRVVWNQDNQRHWQEKIDSGNAVVQSIEDYRATNDNIPTYFLVTAYSMDQFFDMHWLEWLNPRSIAKLNRHNIPILISMPPEYHFYRADSGLDKVCKAMTRAGLERNPVILHSLNVNMERRSYTLPNNGRRLWHEVHSLFWVANASWYLKTTTLEPEGHITSLEEQRNSLENKQRIFFNLNRRSRPLRCMMLHALKYHLTDGWMSFMCRHDHSAAAKSDIERDLRITLGTMGEGIIRTDFENDLQKMVNMLPINLPEEPEESRQHQVLFNQYHHKYRLDSWFELVSETHEIAVDHMPVAIVSEKTMQPIMNHMPFLVAGHRQTNLLLRELGFELFDEEICRYDLGTYRAEDRMHRIALAIGEFKERKFIDRCGWWKRQEKKLAHNFKHLRDTDWHAVENAEFNRVVKKGRG